jgi:beta-1,4-mannosyl-glycoprotein beta-1,4-N-acetylglucosaminyltransferase
VIYDCFIFNNEFKQLDIRLHELDSVVDKFVLVESDTSFSGHIKPLWFANMRHKYAAWRDRIIHVKVKDMPATNNRWEREHFQRNAINRGLVNAQPSDLILISDVDEIPMLHELVSVMGSSVPVRFEMITYYYSVRLRSMQQLTGPVLVRYGQMGSPQAIRDAAQKGPWNGIYLPEAAWHFSFMGGAEAVEAKVRSFAHAEYDLPQYTDPTQIERRIKAKRDPFDRQEFPLMEVSDTTTLPAYILMHPELFKEWDHESYHRQPDL